jgi:tyrosyl-tRNA synthetase
MCHGAAEAQKAADTAQATFEQGGVGDDLPRITVDGKRLAAGVPLLDLLVEAGMAASKGEARRLVQGGGVKVNDNAVTDPALTAGQGDLTADGYIKLSAGKKKHALVIPG